MLLIQCKFQVVSVLFAVTKNFRIPPVVIRISQSYFVHEGQTTCFDLFVFENVPTKQKKKLPLLSVTVFLHYAFGVSVDRSPLFLIANSILVISYIDIELNINSVHN